MGVVTSWEAELQKNKGKVKKLVFVFEEQSRKLLLTKTTIDGVYRKLIKKIQEYSTFSIK